MEKFEQRITDVITELRELKEDVFVADQLDSQHETKFLKHMEVCRKNLIKVRNILMFNKSQQHG